MDERLAYEKASELSGVDRKVGSSELADAHSQMMNHQTERKQRWGYQIVGAGSLSSSSSPEPPCIPFLSVNSVVFPKNST